MYSEGDMDGGMAEKPQEFTGVAQRALLDGPGFIAALRALDPSDLLLLRKKAEYRALGSGMEGEDLFQEAILRTLEEERNCPTDVPLPVYLDNAMRSIADGERTKYVRERPSGIGQPQDGPVAAALDPAPSPSDAALARIDLAEVLESVQQIFENDPQAQAVVIGDMEGWSADEIKDLGGMDDKQYAAARKRVRRGLTGKFGKREQS
jgi:DNA-directed RNA polymerase specialized sigma24 family protein